MAERGEKIVGLLVGRENTFPEPFIATVNRKGADRGVRAEMATLGGTREIEPQRHAVLVDRISHEVPYYRAHLKSAGLQAILKPNTGGGWKDVYRVDSKAELIWAYDQSGGLSPGYRPKTMILQEFIKWEDYIRCIAIGRKDVLPIRYDPTAPFHERYVVSRPVEGA